MGSHDFIKFPPNLGEFSPKTWLLLGEIQEKIKRIGQIPIPPDENEMLHRVYLTKGIHGTTAIEGNSFSEEEVGRIIRNELKVPPSREYQEQEIRNMLKAFNQVGKSEIEGSAKAVFSLELLNSYHKIVLDNLDEILEETIVVGGIRTHGVEVGRYRGAPPEECPRLMEAYCAWLNNETVAPKGFDGYEMVWQIIKALVAHLYFAWIHPYGDGNGRMARLIEFAILLRAGVPDIAAHLLTSFYNWTVTRYYKELQDSHGEYQDSAYPSEGSCKEFIEYALGGYRDELDKQLSYIHILQIKVIWHDFIHASFPKNPTAAQQRRKRLALDLTDQRFEQPVKVSEMREISAAVALAYANKIDRTLHRDVNKLVDMKLLKSVSEGYLPNTAILLGFFANVKPEG